MQGCLSRDGNLGRSRDVGMGILVGEIGRRGRRNTEWYSDVYAGTSVLDGTSRAMRGKRDEDDQKGMFAHWDNMANTYNDVGNSWESRSRVVDDHKIRLVVCKLMKCEWHDRTTEANLTVLSRYEETQQTQILYNFMFCLMYITRPSHLT